MPSSNFAWDEIVIQTSEGPLHLTATSEELDFEGYSDDYVSLSIDQTENGRLDAIKAGNVFYFGKGEQIREIWVARDTLTAFKDGTVAYCYRSDAGLSFRLDKLWVTCIKASHRTEAIAITYADIRESEDLPNLGDQWEDDLVDSFTYERQWIQVA